MLQTETLSDRYQPPQMRRMIQSVEVDLLDVTGLDAPTARELGGALSAWNGGAKPYVWRYADGARAKPRATGARRYLAPAVQTLDLDHEIVRSLGGYDDIVSIIRERRIPIRYEYEEPRHAEARPVVVSGGMDDLTGAEKRDAQGLVNIAPHISPRIDPSGESVVLHARVTQAEAEKLDRLRGDVSRSEFLRRLISKL